MIKLTCFPWATSYHTTTAVFPPKANKVNYSAEERNGMIVKRYKQSDRDMNAVSGTRMLLGLNLTCLLEHKATPLTPRGTAFVLNNNRHISRERESAREKCNLMSVSLIMSISSKLLPKLF